MRLSGEAYSRRLREYSDSTMQLIIDMDAISLEISRKAGDITTNSELSEEEVVEKLKALLESSRKSEK